MSSRIEIIRSFQGSRNLAEYAEFLGVTQGYLSRVLSGKRGTNLVLVNLMSRLPEHASAIAAELSTPDQDESPELLEPVALTGD
jgi:transcriptional regulator with XRE-family HTH domain